MSKLKLSAAAALMALLPLATAHADLPGKHPAYLHALSDLRAARFLIERRPGDAAVSTHEDLALTQIDYAIKDIRDAAIDDGKNVHDHPPVDVDPDRRGHLHKALELLRQVHDEVDREEDDPAVRELKHHSLEHIDAALHETEAAIRDVELHR